MQNEVGCSQQEKASAIRHWNSAGEFVLPFSNCAFGFRIDIYTACFLYSYFFLHFKSTISIISLNKTTNLQFCIGTNTINKSDL